ncbi:MAG: ParB/RepB/Spo0J family partition protein [Planctomycetia bacterium]|nr:ParB/RepB/Spo0J family partition protein [Planctomycetia bacterium]
MANTQSILDTVAGHLDESLGVRDRDSVPPLSPVPRPRDAGRRPVRNVGQVTIDHVMADPDQPRVEFSEESLDRLAQSIRDKGQLSPIRVRWSDELTRWIIVSGERRWRATKRAGLSTIECYFHEEELDRSEILEQQLIENLLREDLQPLEEAKAFASLMEMNGWTGKQVAEALRIAPSQVSRGLALLKLHPDVQAQVAAGEISARSAYEISKLPDPEQQRRLAEQTAAKKYTHADAARAVRQRKGQRAPMGRGTKQTFLTHDGWKVIVSAKRKGNYYEVEQALVGALDEVRIRIQNNVILF